MGPTYSDAQNLFADTLLVIITHITDLKIENNVDFGHGPFNLQQSSFISNF